MSTVVIILILTGLIEKYERQFLMAMPGKEL